MSDHHNASEVLDPEYWPECLCFTEVATADQCKNTFYLLAQTIAQMVATNMAIQNICPAAVPRLAALINHMTLTTIATALTTDRMEGETDEAYSMRYVEALIKTHNATMVAEERLVGRALERLSCSRA